MNYEDIYSQFYEMMTDPTFFNSKDNAYSKMRNWLHNAVATPYIRKIFSEISLDDELMKITYVLNTSVNEDSDKEFVISVFAQFMLISWLQPQVDSVVNTSVVLGSKEEKKIQSNYSATIARLDSLKIQLRKTIRDYGYIYNDYLNGAT